jgi:toxin ParE1/3/4
VKPAILHWQAQDELDQAAGWYNEQQPGLGSELLAEVREAIDQIERNPGIGPRYKDRRFYRLDRFPYLLYYKEFDDHIWIAAIAHQRRRPGYWMRRKPE